MNEIQIFGYLNPLVTTGIILSLLWVGLYVLSWIVQLAWAWVDESKVAKNNWIVIKLSKKLPALGSIDGWWVANGRYNYYEYKDGKPTGKKEDYISDIKRHRGYSGEIYRSLATEMPTYALYLPLIWLGVLCLYLWYISIWVALAYAVAWSARATRRGQKILKAHMSDKDAHK
ncbi:MAG: hypothetical protein KAS32_28500 [Candidatus Peribacteraceae bacterium]|nr:hypothetical protein [Candidatus Peribacteraceae bacterium]